MSLPRVSVVMPVKDVERYVDDAVASIQRQSYTRWELIVCDDGSTDGTRERIRRWARCDGRIRLITNGSSLGVARSLNRSIRIARGELVARMDGDDLSTAQRLETQVAEFEQDPSLVLCGTQAVLIDEEGSRLGTVELPAEVSDIRRFFSNDNPFIHPSVMFRKEAFIRAGGYPEDEVFEDYALWLRFASLGLIKNVHRELVHHRVRRGSCTEELSRYRNRRERLRLQLLATRLFGVHPRAVVGLARSAASVLLAGVRR